MMEFKKVAIFIGLILSAVTGCSLLTVDDQVAFRMPVNAEELRLCDEQPKIMSLQSDESQFSEDKLIESASRVLIPTDGATPLKCPIQNFKNKDVSYDIAFLEFNDKGNLRNSAQKAALRKYISEHPKLNVLVFVHGWRNDASIGIDDVRRFHTMTALSANYAQQRQKATDADTRTLGIYIAWRGKLIKEPGNEWLAERWAALTILNRKPKSDCLVAAIRDELLEIEREVKGENHEKPDRKLLIYAHSLGGNIVLQGLTPKLLERIKNTAPGQPIRGVGDLVVLLNPASEAIHFEPLQKSIRQYIVIREDALDTNSFLANTPSDCEHGDFSGKTGFTREQCLRSGTSTRFSSQQAPILVSLTAAKYYEELTKDSCKWDQAVGSYFPLMQQLSNGCDTPRNQRNSVGNHLPVRPFQDDRKAEVNTPIYGISHEIELDNSQLTKTTYRLAGNIDKSQSVPACPPDPKYMEWQTEAIAQANARGRGWDTEKTKTLLVPHVDAGYQAQKPLVVNIRHGAARQRCVNDKGGSVDEGLCTRVAEASGIKAVNGQRYRIPILGEARDPIWNAAVHSNTIEEHGGYLSHTLWCVVNRFVLDKPSTRY